MQHNVLNVFKRERAQISGIVRNYQSKCESIANMYIYISCQRSSHRGACRYAEGLRGSVLAGDTFAWALIRGLSNKCEAEKSDRILVSLLKNVPRNQFKFYGVEHRGAIQFETFQTKHEHQSMVTDSRCLHTLFDRPRFEAYVYVVYCTSATLNKRSKFRH